MDRKWLNIRLIVGAGTCLLIPRTNTTLLNHSRYDEFHISGYSLAGMTGGRVTLFKHFFVQPELKAGFIHMPDIRTTESKSDRASQYFFFGQLNTVFGMSFRVIREK